MLFIALEKTELVYPYHTKWQNGTYDYIAPMRQSHCCEGKDVCLQI